MGFGDAGGRFETATGVFSVDFLCPVTRTISA